MRTIIASLLVAAAIAGVVVKSPNGELVDGEYIVVLRPDISADDRVTHMKLLGGAKLLFEYNMPGFQGYAVNSDEKSMELLADNADVSYVEQSIVFRAIHENVTEPLACAQVATTLWGLRRVSGAAAGQTVLRRDDSAGNGVDIYIIDTGIYLQHSSFGGRATHVFDSTGQGSGDGNGHGTHCAGTAGGSTYGISNRSPLMAVKVLGSNGSGTTAGVIAGVNFVAGRTGRRVGSMSLGGGFSQASNNAVDAAFRAGAVMVVASGNSNANACNFSPASAPLAISVNAMASGDARSGFSNFGTCTHIFAPGTSILSAWIGSTTATNTISGTSMACPHVAGIAAEIWSTNGGTAQSVRDTVISRAALNRITNPGTGSPNRLAQTVCAV